MICCKHFNREATAVCSMCGRYLCSECANKISPPLCQDCAKEHANSIKGEMIKNIAISVILMIVGIAIIQSPGGVLLAGIPYGWTILNRITPSMFLWLTFIGWIVYFLIKLVLAYIIGIPALIFKLIKWVSELNRVNALLKCTDEVTL